MKTTTLVLILFLTALTSWAQSTSNPRRVPQRINLGLATNVPALPATSPLQDAPAAIVPAAAPAAAPDAASAPATAPAPAASVPAAPAAPKPPEEMIPAGNINFQGVDVGQVLDVYAKLVGRTLLRAGLPSAQIVLRTETPLTKSEAIQALQAVLALNGIALVNVGEKFVKVLPVGDANSAGAKINHGAASDLPDMGSYVTHIVQLKYLKPTEMVPIIQPFAKLANSILPIDANGILVLRDNAENVKRMLEMIDQIDISVPAEYISEVIPIRYALAEDIANALNSLGGSGGATVSIGSSAASPSVSGISRSSGTSTMGGSQQGLSSPGQGQQRSFGSQATGGTPTGGSTFQQRLQSIIQRASTGGGQQDQIQVFGQTKIIADQRSNSLLIFATQADMERIKAVVAKLDVLLAQVLIEAIIVDVSLGNSLSFGVSAIQEQKLLKNSKPTVTTAGVMNNNQPFYNFINNVASSNGLLPGLSGTVPNNFSYFGNIGDTFDIAVQAAANDSSASIIQRPRVQTSQAKPAQFFVGQTVPYITGYYNNGYGNNSSYSQLSVGVELDVTPFINPDGLVVMDINQEIDDLGDPVKIDGNDVYKTVKRTMSSEIAVRDRDTIILGGFVRAERSKSRSGVPLLQDIPILGALFSSRSSGKSRSELIVLMRPTVLRTPEIASAQTVREGQRLPGASAALAEEASYQRKMVEAERRTELKNARKSKRFEGFFAPGPGDLTGDAKITNNIAPVNP
jgi:general secretion pathway protein D